MTTHLGPSRSSTKLLLLLKRSLVGQPPSVGIPA
jgi:hypothetical protein